MTSVIPGWQFWASWLEYYLALSYRDDREALRAENEKLRTDLARLNDKATGRTRSVGRLAGLWVGILVANLGGGYLVRYLINAPSDLMAHLGLLLALALAGLTIWQFVRTLRG